MDDYSKNGKKTAEAMSLSKEGKSAHYYKWVVIAWDITEQNLSCMWRVLALLCTYDKSL